MANTQAIKRRIRTVKSTKQITKAMELVAASKMRRAQEATLRSRAYRNTAREILTRISETVDLQHHPLYQRRTIKNRLVIAISSDRGLAGAYNSNVMKAFVHSAKPDLGNDISVSVIAVGRQMARFVSRLEGVSVLGAYEGFPENPDATDIQPILQQAFELFEQGKVDRVEVLYTDFISSISQEAKIDTLLPAAFAPTEERTDLEDAVFEPSPEAVLETITPKLVEVQLYQALLESFASEHSMRMLAMKNASDNAGDLIDDLTLEFNSARQAAITQELAEITGGAEAIA